MSLAYETARENTHGPVLILGGASGLSVLAFIAERPLASRDTIEPGLLTNKPFDTIPGDSSKTISLSSSHHKKSNLVNGTTSQTA
jgi:hypothetical protein